MATNSPHSLYWNGLCAVVLPAAHPGQQKSDLCFRKKQSVGEGQEDDSQVWLMEDKSTGRPNGGRRRRPPEGTMGAGGDIRNTKKKKRKGGKAGDIGQLVAGSHG